MITVGRKTRVVLAVLSLSVTVVRGAFAEPTNASTRTTASQRGAPALPFFGLLMDSTGPAEVGLSGFLTSLRLRAAARSCVNHCPPASWSVPDPGLGALGRISGAGLALGAGGAGLMIGNLALRGSVVESGFRRFLRRLSVKPVAGGVGLSFSF
jgi:hypothetical protein